MPGLSQTSPAVAITAGGYDPYASGPSGPGGLRQGAEAAAFQSKASKKRVMSRVCNAGKTFASRFIRAADHTKGGLGRKVGKTVDRVVAKVEKQCLKTGLQALQLAPPALAHTPALQSLASSAHASSLQAQWFDAGLQELRGHKIVLKKLPTKHRSALKKLARLQTALKEQRQSARNSLEKDSAQLCGALPELSSGLARKHHATGVLQAAMQMGRDVIGRVSGTKEDDAVKAVNRLWTHAHSEAQLSNIERALEALHQNIPVAARLDAALDECRALQESGRAMRASHRADPAAWDEARARFEHDHMHAWQVFLQAKAQLGALPKPGMPDWIDTLSQALRMGPPTPAETRHFIASHAARALRQLSDNAFDDMCRVVGPGGYLGTLLVHTDAVKSADVLQAWRQAAEEEGVRRYQTEPLHVLAGLAESIEANATQGMSDSGLHAHEIPLPDQADLYAKARDAVHRLLRGMCHFAQKEEGRTQYLSRLLHERAHPEDRDKLLHNGTWRQPSMAPGRESPVMQALMERMLQVTHNAELMGPQYKRLLQELRVILDSNVVGSPRRQGDADRRRLSDFDNLQGALPQKARSVLRRAWDKARFWGGYMVFSGSADMEAKRFAYHQAHVEKRLHIFVKALSRDGADPREVRRAYRDFLDAAGDLRAEFDERQFRETACSEYLRVAFSNAVSQLGSKAIKQVYTSLQQPCPDMARRPPRFPRLANLQAWWRNKFMGQHRSIPREFAQGCWKDLRTAVEQEPEARGYAFQLARLAGKFDRDTGKDYEGMKNALEGIIHVDSNTWSDPEAGTFTAYDAAWSRIRPDWRQNLLGRLGRYEHRMDDFLKADVLGAVAEENRFLYRYFLLGLLASGRSFVSRDPMNRYGDAAAPLDVADDARDDGRNDARNDARNGAGAGSPGGASGRSDGPAARNESREAVPASGSGTAPSASPA